MRYSFKRIATYIPKDNWTDHRIIKRICFIKKYLAAVQNSNTKVFVIDEVGKTVLIFPFAHDFFIIGFGSSALRHYSYAPIG